MARLATEYQAVQTLTVTGLATLANAGTALSAAQASGTWTGFLIRLSATSSAGATANSVVRVGLLASMDGTDYDSSENEKPLATLVFPASGAQTRSLTFALPASEILAPSWTLNFRNETGAALSAATVTYRGVRRQTQADPVSTQTAFTSGFSSGFS